MGGTALIVLPPFGGTPGLHRLIPWPRSSLQAWGSTGHSEVPPTPPAPGIYRTPSSRGERQPNAELSVWENDCEWPSATVRVVCSGHGRRKLSEEVK